MNGQVLSCGRLKVFRYPHDKAETCSAKQYNKLLRFDRIYRNSVAHKYKYKYKYNRINCYNFTGCMASIFLTSTIMFDCLLRMFVALSIRHAMRIRRIMSSVACVTVPYFYIISQKDTIFGEKRLLNL